MLNNKSSFARRNFKRLICFTGLLLVSFFIFAQTIETTESTEKRKQKIQWKEDPNVLEYKIEILNEADEVLISETTEKNYIEFSFAPGNYKYQLIAYDMLGREAVTTEWISFEVISAAEEAERLRLAEIKRKEEERLEQERLAREEEERQREEEERLAREEEEKLRLEEARIAFEKAEQERLEYERLKKMVEEHPLKKATGISVNSKDESKVFKRDIDRNALYLLDNAEAEKGDEVDEEENPEKSKKKDDNRDRKLNISAGGGVPIIIYENDYFQKYFGTGISPAFNLKIDTFPLYRPTWHFGFEVQGLYSLFKKADTLYYSFSLNLINVQSDLVFRQKLGKSVFWWQLKAGGGLTLLQTNVSSSYKQIARTDFSDKFFVYPKVDAGLSVFLIPSKVLFMELGCEYWNVFIPNLNTGIVYPYLSIGIRS